VSRERVRQIQERLLQKLKNYMEKEISGFVRLFAGLAESD
jgi:DNA-directed RNA polymerase sigma subunit (sigma70/sigma32)